MTNGDEKWLKAKIKTLREACRNAVSRETKVRAELAALKAEHDKLLAALAQVAEIANGRGHGHGFAGCIAIWGICQDATAKAKGGELERTVRDREADVYKVIGENAELLAAMEEAVSIGTRWWRLAYMSTVCAAIEDMRQTLKRAIAKAKEVSDAKAS